MDQIKIGSFIARCRKNKDLTQSQLADILGITNKAVSKWERDLSCPDINSLPNLAEILGVSVEELMQIKKEAEAPVSKVAEIMEIAPKAVAMAMGIAVTVLTILNARVDFSNALWSLSFTNQEFNSVFMKSICFSNLFTLNSYKFLCFV